MTKQIDLDQALTATIPAHRTWPIFQEYLQAKKEALEEEHQRGFALADTLRLLIASQADFTKLTGADQDYVIDRVLGKTKNW